MGARTKARKRALDVLFESDLRGLALGATLAEREERARTDPNAPLNPYTTTLVDGVVRHQERIDELLSAYSLGWELSRMPGVDRNLLRLGVYELLWCDDVPDAVAVSEAVSLARELSTDDSPGFVNGLLARILAVKPTLAR